MVNVLGQTYLMESTEYIYPVVQFADPVTGVKTRLTTGVSFKLVFVGTAERAEVRPGTTGFTAGTLVNGALAWQLPAVTVPGQYVLFATITNVSPAVPIETVGMIYRN